MGKRYFHGAGVRRSYFEGWYFKQQTDGETLAMIPAYHVDAHGQSSASLQIITNSRAFHVDYPAESFCAGEQEFFIRLGRSVFTEDGCRLEVNAPGLRVSGVLSFGVFAEPATDIMGAFRHLPGLECRHTVVSFCHRVDGEVVINGKRYVFLGGNGYIEGDRGRSFPKRYVWTHCFTEGGSIMLSVADIPLYGMHFIGCLGFLYENGRETRIATHRGAKVLHVGTDGAVVRQGKLTLMVAPLSEDARLLRAPVSGSMTRLIRESPACAVRYQIQNDTKTIWDFTCETASFEDNWRT